MLVSCIMPTRAREEFSRQAVRSFLSQSWEEKELVILDDDDDPSFPAGIHGKGIRYFREPRATIGRKRNRCCELAAGEIIFHWDDDDWSAPGRMADQVARILDTGSPVTGYRSMEFRDGEDRYLYTGSPLYALGTSLAYRKWYWERVKFVEIQYLPDGSLVAEDNFFVSASARCIATADAGDLMWASIHPGNTSARKGEGNCWKKL